MGQLHHFRTIARYRVHKFDQDKIDSTVAGVPVDYSVCLGACFHWIDNKLTRPNAARDWWRRRTASRDWSDIFTVRPDDPGRRGRNSRIKTVAAMLQSVYTNNLQNGFDFKSIESMLPNIRVQKSGLTPKGGARTIAQQLCAITDRLGRGRAAIVAFVESELRHHAIALYKSRGNSLYCFDPNTGLYVFLSSEEHIFFLRWSACYANKGWVIVPWEVGSGHFVYSTYRRA